MYVPAKHAVDEESAWSIVREAGAGTLVANTPEGLQSVFVPVVVSDDRMTIVSHLAKANRWWRSLSDGDEVLGLFLTASAYVSPSNYPSRLENPGVVPTWNYVAAEVRASVRVHEDPQWLGRQVRLVTDQFEASRSPRWSVDDSSDTYVAAQLRAIVGIELQVKAITGKAKLSQNRPAVDREAVRTNFAEGTAQERNVAARMSDHG
jgi:transcriptional regulator